MCSQTIDVLLTSLHNTTHRFRHEILHSRGVVPAVARILRVPSACTSPRTPSVRPREAAYDPERLMHLIPVQMPAVPNSPASVVVAVLAAAVALAAVGQAHTACTVALVAGVLAGPAKGSRTGPSSMSSMIHLLMCTAKVRGLHSG